MPYLPTSQSWLHHSSLLLQAQPTSTRITTKYTLTPRSSSNSPSTSTSKRRKTNKHSSTSTPASTTTNPTPTQLQPQPQTQQQTKGILTLKTYDPTSGICLKYRTDKAAEVGRLVASLGRLGRYMSGLEVKEEEEGDGEVVGGGEGGREQRSGTGTITPVPEMGVVGAPGKDEGKGKDGKDWKDGKDGKDGKPGAGGEKGKVGGGSGGGGGGKKRKAKR